VRAPALIEPVAGATRALFADGPYLAAETAELIATASGDFLDETDG
jgi:hypothetical protein